MEMTRDYINRWEQVLERIDAYLESTEPMSSEDLRDFQESTSGFVEAVERNPMSSMVGDSLDDFSTQYGKIIELLIKERKKYGIE